MRTNPYELARGMTKREHFACIAMMGLLADHKDHEDERRTERVTPEGRPFDSCYTGPVTVRYSETCAEAVARLAVEHADALVKALSK